MQRKLQRKQGARRALLKNLASSLILYEKITTTLAKAKEVVAFVEHLIAKGSLRDLSARRYLLKYLPRNVVKKMMDEIIPSVGQRKGGYFRILRLSERTGDGAPLAVVEFTDKIRPLSPPQPPQKNKKKVKALKEEKTTNETK